jgi:hypothetical protein
LLLSGLGLCVVALGNVAATQNYSVGDYVRFGMQEAILLRIGLIFLVVVAIEGAVHWRRWRAESLPAAPPPQSEMSAPSTDSSVGAETPA